MYTTAHPVQIFKKATSFSSSPLWTIDWHGSPFHISILQHKEIRRTPALNNFGNLNNAEPIFFASVETFSVTCYKLSGKNLIPSSRKIWVLDPVDGLSGEGVHFGRELNPHMHHSGLSDRFLEWSTSDIFVLKSEKS
jgi:hypothetical protein